MLQSAGHRKGEEEIFNMGEPIDQKSNKFS